jgi:hypothetical protein
MLNNSNPTHKEEENCIPPTLEISKLNLDQSFDQAFIDFVPPMDACPKVNDAIDSLIQKLIK